MEFKLLGPLEIAVDGEQISLGASRQGVILALLLIEANQVVSVDRMIDAVWGDEPPKTAKNQVQITVSAIRRLLGSDVIACRPPGYMINAPPENIDIGCFESLAASGGKAVSEQRTLDALHDLRSALALWRGPALDGIQSEIIQATATRLNERRTSAYQDCFALELQMGRHFEVIGELRELVAENPLNEVLRGQLMLALYRAGRQADALDAFRVGRAILQEELGLDPGTELCRLEQAILVRSANIEPPSFQQQAGISGRVGSRPTPHQLPRTIAEFTGREEILAEITDVMVREADGCSLTVPVVVLTGRRGMGKTALAVRAAHLLSQEFPDGQFFLQLGVDTEHSTASLLEHLLRSLGTPAGGIPQDLHARAAMYRSTLAGRRVLIVIDEAGNRNQISALLPGTSGCAVLMTSDHQIIGLDGIHQIHVGPLDEQSATRLLVTLIGPDRVGSEPEAACELVRLCGGIPLALRVVAAKLSVRPHWRLSHMAVQLQDETRRLDELDLDGVSVRATVAMAYCALPDPAQRLFRRLSLLGTVDFASWVAAPLLDVDMGYAENLLQQLVTMHLVEVSVTGEDTVRFYLHDLVRIYAVEQLGREESTADRLDAMRRLLGCWLFVSATAHHCLYGGDFAVLHGTAEHWPLRGQSLTLLLRSPADWFVAERNSLVTAIHQAAQLNMDELCWDLAVTAATLFETGLYGDEWRSSHASALEVVRRSGNKRGEAALLYSLGTLEVSVRLATSRSYFEQSRKLFDAIGDSQGQALAVSGLALADNLDGQYDEALERYRFAICGFRASGDRASEAYTLKMMAQISADRLDYAAAEQSLDDALVIARNLGAPRLTAQIQYVLAELQLRRGRAEAAADTLPSVLRLTEEAGDIVGQAYTLVGLGNTRRILGDLKGAETALEAALDLAGVAGNKLIRGRSLVGLAELHFATGEGHRALARIDEALTVFREHGAKGVWQARALELLGRIHERAGRLDVAAHVWREAAEGAAKTDPVLAAQIAESLARLRASDLPAARAA
jgi:DNA-binding SARP family transcriptional activator/tetratricopeptide (TPR) repeat protein